VTSASARAIKTPLPLITILCSAAAVRAARGSVPQSRGGGGVFSVRPSSNEKYV